MGLAASQARLLLLTARKSDLEFRAQQITNSEMILAMQTEQIAREYSIKISNQALFFTDATSAGQETVCLTAALIETLAGGNGGYTLLERDTSGEWHTWRADQETINEPLYVNNSTGKQITEADYKLLSDNEKAQYSPLTNDDGSQVTKPCTIQSSGYNELQLLEGIKNGTLKIVNADGEEQSLSGDSGFTQSYYTDDDRAAEAEYEQKTAEIQVKEKRLQNDLNQVETQQKACDTEIDSVKKVMEKNIDRTFKVFS